MRRTLGGQLNSNPEEWYAFDISGRQETGCTGISATPPHTSGTADEPVVTGFWDDVPQGVRIAMNYKLSLLGPALVKM